VKIPSTSESGIVARGAKMDLNQVRLPALGPRDSVDFYMRMGFLIDPAGNRICLYRAGDNGRHPPCRAAMTPYWPTANLAR
jgi:hypothetical protein